MKVKCPKKCYICGNEIKSKPYSKRSRVISGHLVCKDCTGRRKKGGWDVMRIKKMIMEKEKG